MRGPIENTANRFAASPLGLGLIAATQAGVKKQRVSSAESCGKWGNVKSAPRENTALCARWGTAADCVVATLSSFQR
jgi:hypothetical protein